MDFMDGAASGGSGVMAANPLASAAGAGAGAAAAAAAGLSGTDDDDTTTAVAPDFFQKQRRWLVAGERGGPTLLARSANLIAGATLAIGVLYANKMVDLTDPRGLLPVDVLRATSIIGVPIGLLLLSGTVGQLRMVLRPGGGLEQLGLLSAAETTVTLRRASALRLAGTQKIIRWLQLLGSLLGSALVCFGVFALVMFPAWWSWALFMIGLGAWTISAGRFVLDFMLSLQVAATVVVEAVADVETAVRVASLKDSESWESNVVQPALALHTGRVGTLSACWSGGLATSYASCWFLSFTVFLGALATANGSARDDPAVIVFYLVVVLVLILMPLLMTRSVVGVSQACDELLQAINDRRMTSLENNEQLHSLELALKNCNYQQGLGFVVGGEHVMDKKRLRSMLVTVLGLFATVVPIAVSWAVSRHNETEMIFAALPGQPAIFGYSNYARTYSDANKFCRQNWMEPVSISSKAENDALVRLLATSGNSNGQFDAAFIGAVSLPGDLSNEELMSPAGWTWSDGTPTTSWFHPEVDLQKKEDSPDEPLKTGADGSHGHSLTLSVMTTTNCKTGRGGCLGMVDDRRQAIDPERAFGSWRLTDPSARHGILCKAPSAAAFQGTPPGSIKNLAYADSSWHAAGRERQRRCELSDVQQAALEMAVRSVVDSNCTYPEVSLNSLLGGD